MSSTSNLYIVDYSEKAIALFGDTKSFKNKIMEIGGRYNPNLKSGENETKPGYIFSKTKRSDVERLVKQVENGEIQSEQPEEKNYNKNNKEVSRQSEISKQDFMNLVSKVERLEQEVYRLNTLVNKGVKKVESKVEITEEKEYVSEEEEEVKPKRINRKFK